MDLFIELEELYKKCFKNCSGKACYNQEAFKEKCKNGEYYICSHAARIGENYSNSPYKVLIIGQERPYGKSDSVAAIDITPYNPHWVATKLTALKLFNDFSLDKMNDIEKDKSNNQDILNSSLSNICFTNYYKCAYCKSKIKWSGNNMLHSKEMTENCGEILFEELCVLQPDLIIKQGKWSTNSFENKLLNGKRIPVNTTNNNITLYKYEYKINDKINNVFVIYTYHPCARGNNSWKNHKEDLYKCIDAFKQTANRE